MKTLNVIVFASKNEEIKYTTSICEKFANSNLSPDQLFCGVWGEITHNRNECVNSIVSTINHFSNSTKNEIFFGCSEKDFDEIMSKECFAPLRDNERYKKLLIDVEAFKERLE